MDTSIIQFFRGLILSVPILVLSYSTSAQDYSAKLIELDNTLSTRESYVTEKRQTIIQLKKRLEANPNADLQLQFDLCDQLYHQYRSFIYDSAFAYASKLIKIAYEIGETEQIGYAKTQLGFTTLSAGMFKETFDTLSTVQISGLADSTKLDYYGLMSRVLYDLCDYNRDPYYCDIYVDMADKYIEFATSLADPGSYNFLYLNGLRNLRVQRSDEAVRYLNQIFEKNTPITHHERAITASTLSYLHLKLGDTTKAVNLLVDACIADVKSATKETLAMTRLAEILYEQGFVEEAYKYINASMDDANFYGAMQRKSEVGAILPIIAATRLSDVDSQRKTFMSYSIGLTILSVLTIIFAVSTLIQSRRLRKRDKALREANDHLRDINGKLQEVSKIKDEYLGYYFNINSEYIEKIEKFKRSVDQKLINKKFEDIRYVMSRIDLKKEREELYYSFDKVFLKLFPGFVDTFNSYFNDEDKFVLPNEQLLNTELRIFALIRMGITDSDKLAKILGYSVNTIYAYKNRVKSKANVPNDVFEQKIMEIAAI